MVRAAAAALVAVAFLAAGPAAFGQAQTDPHYAQMIAAAQTMQAASRILYPQKQARGLLPPAGDDPNLTGMIGFEYTTMTTTPATLADKRTATSPDFAAGMVKLLAGLNLPEGAPVVTVLSGSYVGGDVAMLAALEQLKLKPVLIISSGTSQWGANNPEFNIIDMLKLLRERGVIQTKAVVAALGGTDGAGGGQDADSQQAQHASAAADGIPVIDTQPLDAETDNLVAAARAALAGAQPAAVINVGAGIVGTGTCDESFALPSGTGVGPIACTRGVAGVLMKMAGPGIPWVHVLNIRQLATDLDIAYDPVPFPSPGANLALYGPAPAGTPAR